MWQIVLVVCGFITLWILLIVFGWVKAIKMMNKEVNITLDKNEHKLKMEQMRKKHDAMERDFDESWSKFKK